MVAPGVIPAVALALAKSGTALGALGGKAALAKAAAAKLSGLYGLASSPGAALLGKKILGGAAFAVGGAGAGALYKNAKKVANLIRPVSKGVVKGGATNRKGVRAGKGMLGRIAKPVSAALSAPGMFKKESRAPLARGPQRILGGLGSILKDKVTQHAVPSTISRLQKGGRAGGLASMVMPRGVPM